MLRWRLLLGTLIIAALVGLMWLDAQAAVPGTWLFPLCVILCLMATQEVLDLLAAANLRPSALVVQFSNLLLVCGSWVPLVLRSTPYSVGEGQAQALAWPMAALAVGVSAIFASEMWRFREPGRATGNLCGGVFTLVYIGLMLVFFVQLRMHWGIGVLASLIIVTKMGDIGAYFVGRFAGRHKLAPLLSPGKTIEGAIGELLFSSLSAWATFAWLLPWSQSVLGEGTSAMVETASSATATAVAGAVAAHPAAGVSAFAAILYGLLVGLAGMIGDLAESLLKRDAHCKDSSRWLPGFGGVLDIVDSLLLAAPVAWLCWALGLVRL